MSARESALIAKFKDGIQEIIVFLRMLEGAKLSPVYDRKRRQLMDKLLDLQGDTRRVAPPSFEGDNEPSWPTSPERMDESRTSVTSEGDGSESGERTHSHRTSKILDMRGKFEQASSGRPNYYKTLDELKKGSPVHKDKDTSAAKGVQEEQQPKEEESPDKEEEAVEDEKEESFEIPEDVPDVADLNQDKSQRKEKKDKKHRPAFFKKLLGPKKERSDSGASPLGSTENINQATKEDKENECISPPSEETTADEPEQEAADDKDAPLVATLNRVSKRLGRTSLQQVQVVLQGTLVKITKLTSKEKDREITEIDLTTSATAQRDNLHFDIITTSKTYTFRTESEEQCSQWTSRLMETIKSCTPDQPEEEELPSSEQQQQPPETPQNTTMAPQISVTGDNGSEVLPSAQEANTLPGSASYENVAYDKRRKKTMPEVSACLVRSYFYRKGTFGWDKVWCVFTHDNTLYISNSESSKKPQLVYSIDLQSKVEKRRGTDKYPHALQLMVGGKREMLASDSEADFLKLMSLLETATGVSAIEELLSEDEGGDLYEDLPDTLDVAPAPQVPSSPRPLQRPLPAPAPVEFDDYDGDIYEGMDDLDMPSNPPPAIPATQPPKKYPPSTATNQPAPSLPPRNIDAPPPTLPPRPPSMPIKPQEYEPAMPSPPTLKKKLARPPIEEEVYDDVIAPVEEETYDDVVAPVMQEEETYDDVVVPVNEPEESYDDVQVGGITEEFYEEMDSSDQGYVAMSKNKKPKDEPVELDDQGTGSEFYTEMDAPPPRPTPPTSQRASFSSSSPLSSPTSSLSRMAARSSNTPSKPAPPPSVSRQSSAKGQSPLINTKTSATSTTKPPYNKTPGVGATKRMQTTGKVASLSRMFQNEDKQQLPSAQKGSHCGSLLYKSSTKPSFVTEWCVLDGSMLQFFSASTDMRSHYKFSLRDAELSLSQKSEMKSGQYGFHLAKSSVVHQFATISKEEFDAWLIALAPVVQKCFPPDGSTYQAKEDHTASGEEDISFKRNDLVWVLSQDSAAKWTGIVSTAENKYAGPCGQFPSAKVKQVLMEDPYI